MLRFYKATHRLQLERSKLLSTTFAASIGSLFDAKIMKQFMASLDRVINKLDPKIESIHSDHRKAMTHTAKELQKLTGFLQGDGGS